MGSHRTFPINSCPRSYAECVAGSRISRGDRRALRETKETSVTARRPGFLAWIDYSFRPARLSLGRQIHDCRAFMLRNERWKYIHYEGFRPQLFDLAGDPEEFVDFGSDPGYARVRAELAERMFAWLRSLNCRQTTPDETAANWVEKAAKSGIVIGLW